ncbi:MAG: sulfotransferase domain-containing protein, partial [Syntrophaceae bacterium]|nr:sulfotransferase domain-containing protein [Syntrophaceae bacterium]
PVAACVRHPIDRAISLYHFFRIHQWPSHEAQHRLIQSKALAADLSTFWETLEIARTARNLRHFKTQSEFLRGAPVVHLLRFENLAEDFRRLAIHLGCPEIQLPHINAALRDSRALTPAAEARIRSFYAEDFDQWYPETS